MDDAAALRRENAELRAQLGRMLETIAKLNERVSELLAIAQRKQRKATTPRPPPEPLSVDGESKLAFENRPVPPELEAKSKSKKERPSPTGRRPLPAHLPVEEHTLRPEACAHCGSCALDAAGEVVEEKLHVVKEHQRPPRRSAHHVPVQSLR